MAAQTCALNQQQQQQQQVSRCVVEYVEKADCGSVGVVVVAGARVASMAGGAG